MITSLPEQPAYRSCFALRFLVWLALWLLLTSLPQRACAQYQAYETMFDGIPAQVRYNTQLTGEGQPKEQYPYLLSLTIFFEEIDQYGNMVSEVREEIDAKEAAFVQSCNRALGGLYSGSFEYLGDYNLYFYLADTARAPQVLSVALGYYEGHLTDVKLKADPGWRNHTNFLLPTYREELAIENARKHKLLVAQGDQPHMLRPVSHRFVFDHEVNRRIFAREIKELDFDVVELPTEPQGPLPHGIVIMRYDVMTLERLQEVTLKLLSLTRSLDGEYEGWEALPVLREEPGQ